MNQSIDHNVIDKVRQFVENETKSCSMDFGCITPEYVYKMLGGEFSLEEIIKGLKELQKQGIPVVVK